MLSPRDIGSHSLQRVRGWRLSVHSLAAAAAAGGELTPILRLEHYELRERAVEREREFAPHHHGQR